MTGVQTCALPISEDRSGKQRNAAWLQEKSERTRCRNTRSMPIMFCKSNFKQTTLRGTEMKTAALGVFSSVCTQGAVYLCKPLPFICTFLLCSPHPTPAEFVAPEPVSLPGFYLRRLFSAHPLPGAPAHDSSWATPLVSGLHSTSAQAILFSPSTNYTQTSTIAHGGG